MTPAQSRVQVSDPSCAVQGDPSVSPSQSCSGAGLCGQPGADWGSTGPGGMGHPSTGLGGTGSPGVPPQGLGRTMCPHSAREQDREGMGVPTPRASVGCPCGKAELSLPPRAHQAPVGPQQSGHGWPCAPLVLLSQIPVPCHRPVPRTAPGIHWHELRPHSTRGMRG